MANHWSVLVSCQERSLYIKQFYSKMNQLFCYHSGIRFRGDEETFNFLMNLVYVYFFWCNMWCLLRNVNACSVMINVLVCFFYIILETTQPTHQELTRVLLPSCKLSCFQFASFLSKPIIDVRNLETLTTFLAH